MFIDKKLVIKKSRAESHRECGLSTLDQPIRGLLVGHLTDGLDTYLAVPVEIPVVLIVQIGADFSLHLAFLVFAATGIDTVGQEAGVIPALGHTHQVIEAGSLERELKRTFVDNHLLHLIYLVFLLLEGVVR